MFGISTVWQSKNSATGEELIKKLEDTGIPGVELEYRITSEKFEQIKKALKSSSLKVLSIHNYMPHPEILPDDKASGDALLLSSTDEDERKLAVKYTLRSIRNAHDLEAGAVVLHLGKVDMPKERGQFFDIFDSGGFKDEAGKQFLSKKLKERDAKQPKNFDAVLYSLDQLNEEAIKLNIMLGAENRYYFTEIPNYEEVGLILNTFYGGNIGYWHDCGHAQAAHVFGLKSHETFLKAYSDHLVGMHLHDCKGYNDHIAPGQGDIDFDMIQKYLHDDVIRIIEVNRHVESADLKNGVTYLKSKNII